MQALKRIFNSSRAVTALAVVIAVVLYSILKVPEEDAWKIAAAIVVLGATVVGGTALEDAALKLRGIKKE